MVFWDVGDAASAFDTRLVLSGKNIPDKQVFQDSSRAVPFLLYYHYRRNSFLLV